MACCQRTSEAPPSNRRLRGVPLSAAAVLLLLSACGPLDDCPHRDWLSLDLRPYGDDGTWRLTTGGTERRRLEGDILSLTFRHDKDHRGEDREAGLIAAGLLFDGSAAPQLFALTLNEDLCVLAAWRSPLDPPEATVEVLLALPDGGLALGGWLPGEDGPDDRDAWISRYARGGEQLWQFVESDILYVSEELRTPSREAVQALALDPDLGLLAAGTADINQALHSNWLLRLDEEGRVVRRVDLPRDDPRVPGEIVTLIAGSDGTLWLAGSLNAPDAEADPWLLVLGPHHNLLWDRRYPEPGRQTLADAALLQHANGDVLVMVGRQGDASTGDGWISAVDAEGSPLWSSIVRRQSAAAESLAAVVILNGLIVAGGEFGRGNEGLRTWLTVFDGAGQQRAAFAPLAGSVRTLLALGEGLVLAGGSDAEGGPLLFLTTIDTER